MLFKACDQVWNANRLGQKGMPLDQETRSCLRFRDQTREKNNRRSVQCRIRFNPGGDFAAVDFRHYNIKKNQVGLNSLRGLVSLRRIIFFPNRVAPAPFESAFGRVSEIATVIDD